MGLGMGRRGITLNGPGLGMKPENQSTNCPGGSYSGRGLLSRICADLVYSGLCATEYIEIEGTGLRLDCLYAHAHHPTAHPIQADDIIGHPGAGLFAINPQRARTTCSSGHGISDILVVVSAIPRIRLQPLDLAAPDQLSKLVCPTAVSTRHLARCCSRGVGAGDVYDQKAGHPLSTQN